MRRPTLGARGWRSDLAGRCRPHRSLLGLVVVVASWWLVIFGMVALLAPSRARAASSPIVAGRMATIYAPPLQAWPIPIERSTFDDYHRAFGADDEGALTEVVSRPGWVTVADRQRVSVVVVDGEAAQVEILDGPHAGGRGWLKTRQLRPSSQE